MDSKTGLMSNKGWAMALLALTCSLATGAHAAEPLSGMNLKLDVALLNPEDCEEGDLTVPSLSIAKPPASPAVTAEPIQLAKLAPAAERAKSSEPVEQVAAAQAPKPAAAAAKPAAPAPAPASASTEVAKPAPVWDIVPGDKTLNAALARWAAQAGWQLVWELPVDYAVEARTVVPGSFEEAVGTVARSMDSAEIPMKAIFYSGNKVLRIVAKGVQ